jgi:hypothetical protein
MSEVKRQLGTLIDDSMRDRRLVLFIEDLIGAKRSRAGGLPCCKPAAGQEAW